MQNAFSLDPKSRVVLFQPVKDFLDHKAKIAEFKGQNAVV